MSQPDGTYRFEPLPRIAQISPSRAWSRATSTAAAAPTSTPCRTPTPPSRGRPLRRRAEPAAPRRRPRATSRPCRPPRAASSCPATPRRSPSPTSTATAGPAPRAAPTRGERRCSSSSPRRRPASGPRTPTTTRGCGATSTRSSRRLDRHRASRSATTTATAGPTSSSSARPGLPALPQPGGYRFEDVTEKAGVGGEPGRLEAGRDVRRHQQQRAPGHLRLPLQRPEPPLHQPGRRHVQGDGPRLRARRGRRERHGGLLRLRPRRLARRLHQTNLLDTPSTRTARGLPLPQQPQRHVHRT
jgi:hypothetical protein